MNNEQYYHWLEQKQEEQILEDVSLLSKQEVERWLKSL